MSNGCFPYTDSSFSIANYRNGYVLGYQRAIADLNNLFQVSNFTYNSITFPTSSTSTNCLSANNQVQLECDLGSIIWLQIFPNIFAFAVFLFFLWAAYKMLPEA